MSREIFYSFLCASVLTIGSSCCSVAEELSFLDLYEKNATPESANIEVEDGDVLVFPAGGQLVLHGKRLVVSARVAKLDGDFHLTQYDDSDTPEPIANVAKQGNTGAAGRRPSGRNGDAGKVGEDGGIGDQGTAGPAAEMVVLDIDVFMGNGRFFLDNRGAIGGKGGKGGKGGTGGRGEDGAEGSTSLVDCKAGGGDGGPGGGGGTGGPGGPGGPGGAGGKVRLSDGMMRAMNDSKLMVDVRGGAGGAGGDGGEKGDGGLGGAGGAGNGHCGGGSGGDGGKQGEVGRTGDVGVSGADGTVEGLD